MKNYTVILCLCDRGGMTFNKRRQSRDNLLIEDLLKNTDEYIYIEEYSLPLFVGYEDRVKVISNLPADVPEGGILFTERVSPDGFLEEVSRLIIYCWGRKYPFDTSFKTIPEEVGFSKVLEYEFAGSSHEKITKGVFER